MPKINQLDRSVFELIAAGEVIERPASVIKELVENSIDSGAHRITVDIKRGGVLSMTVSDDGCGISYEDVPLAFSRHATSKVYSAEDLEKINTLGFRGEALASVCAVAKVEMITKRSEDDFGTFYALEGGKPVKYEKTGRSDGTTVTVRDLFYNTPARLKFLKKDVTEGNYCQSAVEKLALAHPFISFKFFRDGRQVLFTSGDGEYYSAVRAVFGKQFAAGMIPAENVYRNIGVTGFVCSPLFTRANRSMQHFFVNGRSVKSPLCSAALEEAFRNTIMVGKFPSCVLCVNLDPALLDANISPSKTEVRFSDERAVFDAVYMAVKNALLGYDESREIKLGEQSGEQPATAAIPADTAVKTADDFFKIEFHKPETQVAAVQPTLYEAPKLTAEEPVKTDEPQFTFLSEKSFEKKPEPVLTEQETVPESADDFPEAENIRVIGELFKTYILCESSESLILIDKHAAHERINFERFKKGINLHGQLLLEPRRVYLTPEQYEAVGVFRERLESIGLIITLLGDNIAQVDGVPQSLEDADPEELLQSVAAVLAQNNGNAEGVLFDDALHTMACKASIRANENQDISELAYLANIVLRDNSIRYCPHGRPVITQISKKQIEKYFGRIV